MSEGIDRFRIESQLLGRDNEKGGLGCGSLHLMTD